MAARKKPPKVKSKRSPRRAPAAVRTGPRRKPRFQGFSLDTIPERYLLLTVFATALIVRLIYLCQLNDVAVSGNHAFVADDSSGGLQVIDISDPTNPVLADSYNTPGFSQGVAVSGDHAFVADETSGLQVIQVFESRFDTEGNIGQSLTINPYADNINSVRLTTTQTESVTWEISADGGSNWEPISHDGTWTELMYPGNDLRWRSTHAQSSYGVNPACSELTLEWKSIWRGRSGGEEDY